MFTHLTYEDLHPFNTAFNKSNDAIQRNIANHFENQFAPANYQSMIDARRAQEKLSLANAMESERNARISPLGKALMGMAASGGIGGAMAMDMLQKHPELVENSVQPGGANNQYKLPQGGYSPSQYVNQSPSGNMTDMKNIESIASQLKANPMSPTPGVMPERRLPLSPLQIQRLQAIQKNGMPPDMGIAGQLAEGNQNNQGMNDIPNDFGDLAKFLRKRAADEYQLKVDGEHRRQEALKISDWTSIPAPAKDMMLGYANAMGYRPDEAVRLFKKGQTVDDLAKAKGLDPNKLEDPVYLATRTTQTTQQKGLGGLGAMEELDKSIQKAMSPFQGTSIYGVSPKFLTYAEGTPEQRKIAGEYLGAYFLATESNLSRARILDVPVGIGMLKKLLESSQYDVPKVPAIFKNEDVMRAMSDFIHKELGRSYKASTKAVRKGISGYLEDDSQDNKANSPYQDSSRQSLLDEALG